MYDENGISHFIFYFINLKNKLIYIKHGIQDSKYDINNGNETLFSSINYF